MDHGSSWSVAWGRLMEVLDHYDGEDDEEQRVDDETKDDDLFIL